MYVVAYLKSLSIIDIDLSHLQEAHTSQFFLHIPKIPFFVQAHLSDDVVSSFAMHVVAFRLLLCIILDHSLILGE